MGALPFPCSGTYSCHPPAQFLKTPPALQSRDPTRPRTPYTVSSLRSPPPAANADLLFHPPAAYRGDTRPTGSPLTARSPSPRGGDPSPLAPTRQGLQGRPEPRRSGTVPPATAPAAPASFCRSAAGSRGHGGAGSPAATEGSCHSPARHGGPAR